MILCSEVHVPRDLAEGPTEGAASHVERVGLIGRTGNGGMPVIAGAAGPLTKRPPSPYSCDYNYSHFSS
jgi:hypothetical protein